MLLGPAACLLVSAWPSYKPSSFTEPTGSRGWATEGHQCCEEVEIAWGSSALQDGQHLLLPHVAACGLYWWLPSEQRLGVLFTEANRVERCLLLGRAISIAAEERIANPPDSKDLKWKRTKWQMQQGFGTGVFLLSLPPKKPLWGLLGGECKPEGQHESACGFKGQVHKGKQETKREKWKKKKRTQERKKEEGYGSH